MRKPRITYTVARVLLGLESPIDLEDAMGLADINLEDAGLEEAEAPVFGLGTRRVRRGHDTCHGGVMEQVEWFSDGEDCRYEAN